MTQDSDQAQKAIAAYLLERDEAHGFSCEHANEAERMESAKQILALTRAPSAAALVEALEWYADPISYAVTQIAEPRSAAHADGGKRALAALAAAKGQP